MVGPVGGAVWPINCNDDPRGQIPVQALIGELSTVLGGFLATFKGRILAHAARGAYMITPTPTKHTSAPMTS